MYRERTVRSGVWSAYRTRMWSSNYSLPFELAQYHRSWVLRARYPFSCPGHRDIAVNRTVESRLGGSSFRKHCGGPTRESVRVSFTLCQVTTASVAQPIFVVLSSARFSVSRTLTRSERGMGSTIKYYFLSRSRHRPLVYDPHVT